MLFKNVTGQKIHVYAYDSTTGAAKTGDANNITGYISLDGTANAIDDTNPEEVDATNMPGIYAFDLTAAETNCDSFALYAKSTTSNIRIEPIIGFTSGAAIPKVAAGSNGGLLIAGSNAATTFAALTCTGQLTVSDGVVITCSTATRDAVTITAGATSGAGVVITGIANGAGIYVTGGAASGDGIYMEGGSTAIRFGGSIEQSVGTVTLRDTTLATLTSTGAFTIGQLVVNGTAITVPANIGTGTSTLDAAGVWGYATRVLTANTNLGLPASWPANWSWSTFNATTDTVARVTLVDTTTALTGKAGFALSATGLDAIADPDDLTASTVPSTFTQKLRWLIQRFWKADKSVTNIRVKNEAGDTITTQAITASGDDETLGAPT